MAEKTWPYTRTYVGLGDAQPELETGTRVMEATQTRVTVALPEGESWHGSDGEKRFLVMTPQVAQDLMHALEWWKDER